MTAKNRISPSRSINQYTPPPPIIMRSTPKLLLIATALAFDFSVSVNSASSTLSAASSSMSSSPTTSPGRLCHYADLLDELEQELDSSGTTYIMRHEPRGGNQILYHHRHNNNINFLLGAEKLSKFQQKTIQRKTYRKSNIDNNIRNK
jgi:hypothetical protein